MQGIEPNWPHVRQISCLLCHCFGPYLQVLNYSFAVGSSEYREVKRWPWRNIMMFWQNYKVNNFHFYKIKTNQLHSFISYKGILFQPTCFVSSYLLKMRILRLRFTWFIKNFQEISSLVRKKGKHRVKEIPSHSTKLPQNYKRFQ